jgi:hypothetical protein
LIDTLYVNGCSWTAGNELDEDPVFVEHLTNSGMTLHKTEIQGVVSVKDSNDNLVGVAADFWNEFTWAKNLADKLNLNLTNDSTGGASNARIVRTTIDYVRNLSPEQRKQTLVIIGWSASERNEICITDSHDIPDWYRFNVTQKFSESLTLDQKLSLPKVRAIDEFQKLWLADVFNIHERVHCYFQGVYLLSNLLENLGIRYYFFNSLPNDVVIQNDFGSWLSWHDNHNNIRRIDSTMFHFVDKHNYKIAPAGHPLVEAHAAWAEELLHDLTIKNVL